MIDWQPIVVGVLCFSVGHAIATNYWRTRIDRLISRFEGAEHAGGQMVTVELVLEVLRELHAPRARKAKDK